VPNFVGLLRRWILVYGSIMPQTEVANEFLDLLEKSELLAPERFASAVEKLGLRDLPSAKAAAELLVKRRLLTRFQAERLLTDRYRGFLIGQYKVLDLLGSGGMGCIYIAEHRQTERVVALKVLNEAAKNDAGLLARFELEARAGIRLNHPDIVRTYEVEPTGHVAYVVMEFVEGINLHELTVLQGPISWQQACDFICQAASGLQHAHEAGLVHRDVKPSNLLIALDGRVKILDFGLALLDGGESEDEFSLAMIFGHDCLGTADYMAPEQSRDSLGVDVRADVYGLGTTFFYAVTGVVPFPADSNVEKLEAHRTAPIPSVRLRVNEVPEEVDLVLAKMMAKDPADRYQSMIEVREALLPFAERRPLEFDFQRVLRIRAADARRRLRHDRQSRKQAALAADSTASGAHRDRADTERDDTERDDTERGDSSKKQARVETVVGGDTRPGRSAISLSEPFGSSRSQLSGIDLGENNSDITETFADSSLGDPAGPVSYSWLVALEEERWIPLTADRFVIGRGGDCEIQLSLGGVSTRHCQLEAHGNCYRVTDLDSKNGIQVNGLSVTDHLLAPGDVLTIGKIAHFRLETNGDPRTIHQPSRFDSRFFWITAAIAATLLAVATAWWFLP
jgi:serine/threonine protein kinase